MDILNTARSGLRKKLLSYFFSNPDAQLYLREISSVLRVDPGNLSKEFKKLEKDGIFTVVRKGNIKLYSVNKQNPVYREMRAIISKTIGTEGLLKDAFAGEKGIEEAFIYGSFARNKDRQGSDIDIFIIGDFDKDRLLGKINSLENRLGREIHYTYWQKERLAEELKKGDSFLTEVLNGKKIMLKGNSDGIQAIFGPGKAKKG